MLRSLGLGRATLFLEELKWNETECNGGSERGL